MQGSTKIEPIPVILQLNYASQAIHRYQHCLDFVLQCLAAAKTGAHLQEQILGNSIRVLASLTSQRAYLRLENIQVQ